MKKSDALPRVDVVCLMTVRNWPRGPWIVAGCRVSQLEEAYEAYRRAGATDKACYRVLWENVSQEMIFCEAVRKAVKQVIAAAEKHPARHPHRVRQGGLRRVGMDCRCLRQPLLLAATMEDLYTSSGLRYCDGVLHYNGLCMRGCDNTFRLMKLAPGLHPLSV